MTRITPLLLVVSALLAAPAQAETVTVPFTSSGGIYTSGTYSGDVSITVSGTGWSSGSCLNDAFYVFSGCGSPYYNSSWYHLRINSAHPANQIGLPAYDSSHVYTFTYNLPSPAATVQFWVSDGNFSDNGGSYTIEINPANLDPLAEAGGPYAVDEGGSVTLDGSGSSDSDGSIVDYSWDCEDDGVFDQTGASPTVSCSYDDDGTVTARLVVTDDLGATAEDVATVEVANLAPSIGSATTPADVSEGQVVGFSAVATDPGPLDTATLTWSWGDGSPDDVGDSVTHAFPDDGLFTVTITADDGDGGSTSASLSVGVANVAPVFTSSPPSVASEGTPYTWTPSVFDPAGAADPLAFTLSAGPAGMTGGPDGTVDWTPTFAQALAGSTSALLLVDDGDGGSASLNWSITISWIDEDGDLMADTWEDENSLDSTDPDDADDDPDGDGLSNLLEFEAGTDPNAFGGPTTPLPLEPIGGEETTSAPSLTVENATDPDGDPVTLEWELYEDATLTALVIGGIDLPQDPSGETTWSVGILLVEAADYYWRARAADPWASGPWSTAESFVVNGVNEPPTAPVPASPLDGELVATVTPLLQWGPSTDPDGDTITYEVEVHDDESLTAAVASADGLGDDTGFLEWTVDVALAEDLWHYTRARATDEHGLSGDWSEVVAFLPTADAGAPAGVAILSPEDGSETDSASPPIVAGGAVDPEGQALTYRIEVGVDPSFAEVDGADVADDGGQAEWDLAADGVTLPENTWVHARARAGDPDGLWSSWATATFFVNEVNEPPTVPTLVAPAADAEVIDQPIDLVVAWSEDVDEDAIRYDVLVARDDTLEDTVVLTEGLDGGNTLLDGTGETAVPAGTTLEAGTWFFSARAVDEHGLASDWAEPNEFVVRASEVEGDDDDDDDTVVPDCGCSAATGSAGWLSVLGLLAVGLRRRRVRG